MKNLKIRDYAKKKNVCLWEIANELGIYDTNFSRKLRVELPKEEAQNIIKIIDKLAKEKEGN